MHAAQSVVSYGECTRHIFRYTVRCGTTCSFDVLEISCCLPEIICINRLPRLTHLRGFINWLKTPLVLYYWDTMQTALESSPVKYNCTQYRDHLTQGSFQHGSFDDFGVFRPFWVQNGHFREKTAKIANLSPEKPPTSKTWHQIFDVFRPFVDSFRLSSGSCR